jgi:hypothetical protein
MLGEEVPSLRVAGWGLAIGGVVLAAVAGVFALLHAWRYPAGGESGGAARVAALRAPRLQTAPQDEHAASARSDARAVQRLDIDAAMAAVVRDAAPGGSR